MIVWSSFSSTIPPSYASIVMSNSIIKSDQILVVHGNLNYRIFQGTSFVTTHLWIKFHILQPLLEEFSSKRVDLWGFLHQIHWSCIYSLGDTSTTLGDSNSSVPLDWFSTNMIHGIDGKIIAHFERLRNISHLVWSNLQGIWQMSIFGNKHYKLRQGSRAVLTYASKFG